MVGGLGEIFKESRARDEVAKWELRIDARAQFNEEVGGFCATWMVYLIFRTFCVGSGGLDLVFWILIFFGMGMISRSIRGVLLW